MKKLLKALVWSAVALAGAEVLSAEEFYLEGLERRYARVSRCC